MMNETPCSESPDQSPEGALAALGEGKEMRPLG